MCILNTVLVYWTFGPICILKSNTFQNSNKLFINRHIMFFSISHEDSLIEDNENLTISSNENINSQTPSNSNLTLIQLVLCSKTT